MGGAHTLILKLQPPTSPPPPSPSIRIYDTQRSVTVFQSAWLNEVVRKRCTVHDVPLGQYLVLPHYLVQVKSKKTHKLNKSCLTVSCNGNIYQHWIKISVLYREVSSIKPLPVQVCMSGDPFKTPEPAALMEVHRERGNRERGGEATNRSLSQLLAEREKRKESQLSCSTGKNTALKNSREFHGSQSGGDTEREGAGGGGGEVGKNSERGEGVRDMLALWDRLLELSQTTCLKGESSPLIYIPDGRFSVIDQKFSMWTHLNCWTRN